MGEAKRKEDQLKAELRKEMARWTGPYTEDEKNLVDAVSKLPVLRVPRAPKAQLEWSRMKPRYCHDNAVWMEENDPDGEARAVSGWFVLPGHLVLHSVLRQRGNLVCVTPLQVGHNEWLRFIPDGSLVRSKTSSGQYTFKRDGISIGFGIRTDVDFMRKYWATIEESLSVGKSMKAILADAEKFLADNKIDSSN